MRALSSNSRASARSMESFLLLAALVFLGVGCATPKPQTLIRPFTPFKSTARAPVSTLPAPAISFYEGFKSPTSVTHTVGPFETLWRISKTYGVDMNDIMQANQITNPGQLKEGQKLTIPGTMGARPYISLPPATRWTHIVVHHTATHDGDASTIQKIHFARGFWNGLGYHFLIDNGTNGRADGQIEIGPRWAKQMDGAHANADDMNIKGIGVCLVGNFSETNVSPRQIESLVYVVQTLQKRYGIPDRNVIRHDDVKGKSTECPGLRFPWAEFKRRLAAS